MSRIYISYRRADAAAYAGRLFDHLSHHFGPDFVFMDIQGGIARGQDFAQAIDAALNTCDVVLVIIGKHWATSTGPDGNLRLHDPNDWVRVETAAALRRNVLVIPVLIDGASLPDPGSLPEELRPLCRRHVCELTDSRWSFDVGELVKDIEKTVHPPKRIKILSFRNNSLYWSVGVVIALAVLFGIGIFESNLAWFKQSIPTPPPSSGPARVEGLRIKILDVRRTRDGDATLMELLYSVTTESTFYQYHPDHFVQLIADGKPVAPVWTSAWTRDLPPNSVQEILVKFLSPPGNLQSVVFRFGEKQQIELKAQVTN